MFGEKYSRLKFWVIWIFLLILLTILSVLFETTEFRQYSLLYLGSQLVISFAYINALANRIRDYNGNEWLSILALVPLVNIGIHLYYGIVEHKKIPVENSDNIEPSLSSTDFKKTYHSSTNSIKNEEMRIEHENLIYEYTLDEIENGEQQKGLWAKAIANSEGSDAKAKSLYIQSRVHSIKDELKRNYTDYENLSKDKLRDILKNRTTLEK